jgi:predicted amino acid racemase
VSISVISAGNSTLFRSFDQNKTEVSNMKMSERFLKVSELDSLPPYLDRIDLTLNAKVIESKKIANLPIVRFFFNKKNKTAKKRKVDKEDK